METQKVVNLLNSSEIEFLKFATKKWCVVDSEIKGNYSHHDPIKFLAGLLESSLCDYSDVYVLVTGDIAVQNANDANFTAAAKVIFKNCAPFKNCRTEINDTLIDEADFINVIICIIQLNTAIIIMIHQKV